METQYRSSVNGQEAIAADLNELGETAALADDRVLAELLRVTPYDGVSVQRGIIPYAVNGAGSAQLAANSATIAATAAPDGSVRVMPFRAVVGSSVAAGSDPKENWQGVRSALALGSATAPRVVQLDPTIANHRWDLVYARVDVDLDDATQSRRVKTSSGLVAQSVVVSRRTLVTVAVQKGSEGASPSRPATPSDGANYYIIPLAYVILPHPHTGISQIHKWQIQEVFKPLALSRATGAVTCAPANMHYAAGGAVVTQNPWTTSTRPKAYRPPSQSGAEVRTVSLSWSGSDATLPLNATSLVDDSIDWRNREFLVSVSGKNGTAGFASEGATGPVPAAANAAIQFHAQSYGDDTAGAVADCSGTVANLTSSVFAPVASSASVQLYVDSVTGALKAKVGSVDPECTLFFWIMATAPNAAAPGSG